MTAATKHIAAFNQLDGRTVTVAQLKEIKARIDASLKKQHSFDLEEISRRLAVGIDKAGKDDVRVKIESVAKVIHHEETTSFYGVEYIADDKDLDGKPLSGLDGISDTTYKVVTEKIIKLIEKGGLVWRKPWNAGIITAPKQKNEPKDLRFAHNYVTRRVYRGSNFYLNWMSFSNPYFFTFKQITELKGKVKKGAEGNPVIYFKMLYRDNKKNKLVDAKVALDASGKVKPGYSEIPGLFYYTVFNHDQTEGIVIKHKQPRREKPKPEEIKQAEEEAIESCEKIVDGMPMRPPITNEKGDRAFYRPSTDSITMPLVKQFEGRPQYYSVLFHEMVHSTGSPNRLNRDMTGRQFDPKYCHEELVAEVGACFLCAEAGILYHTLNNSAAYVEGYKDSLLKAMGADSKFFITACNQAQKAADFILGDGEKAKKAKRETFKPKSRGKKKEVPVDRSREPKARKTQKVLKMSKAQKGKVPKVPNSSVPKVPKVPETEPAMSGLAGLGFITADKNVDQPAGTFTLPGTIGELLGQQQRYKLEIIIAGETHSSKSELGKQIADAFCSIGDDVAWVDWEQGGLKSKDTKGSIDRNVKPENRKRFHVSSEVPRTKEALKALSKHFKVVAVDSGSKLKEMTNAWIDELREECPNTVWIILMQQNAKGVARGGPAAEFDAPAVLKTYRLDEGDYSKNYAYVFKNRGNKTGQYYNISSKKILSRNPELPEPEQQQVKEERKASVTL